MKKIHPFFFIGTLGTIVIAVLHMVFALLLGLTSIHFGLMPLYLTFITFLFIGARLSHRNLT